MSSSNDKKKKQLGMPQGTASNRLKKSLMFSLLQRLNDDVCFQCGERIETVDDLSVEHKEPWLDSENPAGLFFDLNNVAFSHLVCNIKASRVTHRVEHGLSAYVNRGCRCDICKAANTEAKRVARKKRKTKYGKDRP